MTNFEPIEFDWELDAKLRADKANAISWAQGVLALPMEYAIVDTETTELANPLVIQLAIINFDGNPIYETLVKPKTPGLISPNAFSKHGLSDELLANAQSWRAVNKIALNALDDLAFDAQVPALKLLAYGSDFDRRAIAYTCEMWGIPDTWPMAFDCVMSQYAKYIGNWNPYYQTYTWPKLPEGDHSALGDCRATLDLIRAIANEDA